MIGLFVVPEKSYRRTELIPSDDPERRIPLARRAIPHIHLQLALIRTRCCQSAWPSDYIIKYDKDAQVVSYFGGTGGSPGQLRAPHGLWWDNRPGREPALVVADRANARLQYFSAEGEHLGFFDDMLFPADIDLRGDVMVVPDLHARITLLDVSNKVIAHLGHDPAWTEQVLADNFSMRRQPQRWQPGKFVHPHDACFDHDGNIYLAEWVAIGRVSLLKHVR